MNESSGENLTPYQKWKINSASASVEKSAVNNEPEDNLTPYQRWKKNLGTTRPWDMLNPNVKRVDKDVAEARFSICKGCEHLTKTTNQCKKCGCLMHLKTQLAAAECPIGKWAAVS